MMGGMGDEKWIETAEPKRGPEVEPHQGTYSPEGHALRLLIDWIARLFRALRGR